MKRIIISFSIFLLFLSCSSQKTNRTTKSFASKNVTLIHTHGPLTEKNMSVIVEGNRITKIGNTDQIDIQEGVQVIDANYISI